jgi:hypothetical protein
LNEVPAVASATKTVLGTTPAALQLQVFPEFIVSVPLPLLVVLERTRGTTLTVRLPLFQVMGLSWVTVMVEELAVIVPLPELTVMDLPIVQAVVVLNETLPPLKVRKAALSAPLPNRVGLAKVAVPAFKMNLVTLPLALLKAHEVVPALVIVPA